MVDIDWQCPILVLLVMMVGIVELVIFIIKPATRGDYYYFQLLQNTSFLVCGTYRKNATSSPFGPTVYTTMHLMVI